MTPVTHALTSALLHFIWQGIAVGLLLWITLFVLRRNSANSRYAASCIALAVLALAPVMTGWMAYQPESAASGISSAASIGSAPGFLRSAGSVAPVITESLKGIDVWILPLWVTGVLIFALRLAWAGGHASSLRRHGEEAEAAILSLVASLAERAGVKGSIRVLMSSIAEMPSVVGWIRPVLLLPAAVVVGLTPQQLEAVIAHELAHIRRKDYLVNILQSVVETLLFYHPAVWWVSSRIRDEREICCDDLAVAVSGDAVCYARALAHLERMRVFKPSLAMGSAKGPLFHRIQRLLAVEAREQGPSRWSCAVGLLAAVFYLGFHLPWASSAPGPGMEFQSSLQVSVLPPLPVQAQSQVVAPLPLVEPLPVVPPVQPLAPSPPTVAQAAELRSLAELELAQARWVLLRGGLVIMRGGLADEAAAKAVQGTMPGDLLWFELGGKTYVTQDKETLDRLQALSGESPDKLPGIAEKARAQVETLQTRLRNVDLLVKERLLQARQADDFQVSVDELRANVEHVQKQLEMLQASPQRRMADALRAQQEVVRRIEEIQKHSSEQKERQQEALRRRDELEREVEEVQKRLLEQKKLQQETIRLRDELNRTDDRVRELLQETVRSGKAQAR